MGERHEAFVSDVRGDVPRDSVEQLKTADRGAGGVPATVLEDADIPGLLALLPAFEDEIKAGEQRLRECVLLLRAQRATWREIGDALQVSRQAAWERFRTS